MGTGGPSLPSSPTYLFFEYALAHSKLNNYPSIILTLILSIQNLLGQALDLLVQLSLTCYHAYTRCLSTT